MDQRDLIVTPIFLLIVYAVAYRIRPWATDGDSRGYFIPALTAKIVGAIALGTLYQFYYRGGDTIAFHTHGSRELWKIFMDSPTMGLRFLFANGYYESGFYDYIPKIWYYHDQQSYFIIRIATVFDLITFSSYSSTAILFAVLGFSGGWMMFLTFYKVHPQLHKWIAISILFVPSVIFWGSGILKDTVMLGFLGIATYCFYMLFVERQLSISKIIILGFSLFVIFSVKKYILISFMAAAMVWVFFSYFSKIRSMMMRILLIPFISVGCGIMTYVAISKVMEDDPRYALDKIAETSRITAYDIRYFSGKDAGSGYTLGELDGTLTGMMSLAPKAINVSLFRPYLWEIKNPLMLLSALESLVFMILTLYVLFAVRTKIFTYLQMPEVAFCLVFSMIFAFGVGVSTYNFGTLSRYKIPLIPYYSMMLGFILHYFNNDRKLDVLEEMENR